MTFRNLRLALAPVAVLSGGLLLVSNASASVINTLLTSSTGNITVTLNSLIFNFDSTATGTCALSGGAGCNSHVVSGTSLAFVGGPLAVAEGIYINNGDLTSSPPTDLNNFMTFAGHANLVFSLTQIGPGAPNTNCGLSSFNGSTPCSVFGPGGGNPGSPIILSYVNGHTDATLGVAGKASDTGVAGLAGGSNYGGGFSQSFTDLLPNSMLPTPANIQLYFCPSGTCTAADFAASPANGSGKHITTSQAGSFTASPVPEPSSVFLGSLGIVMLLVGARFRKSYSSRA